MIAATALAGTALTASPAYAAADACAASAYGTVHGDCVFVATGGFYKLYLVASGAYSWAAVGCQNGGQVAWTATSNGTSWDSFYVNSSVCTLHVESNGSAYAYVVKA